MRGFTFLLICSSGIGLSDAFRSSSHTALPATKYLFMKDAASLNLKSPADIYSGVSSIGSLKAKLSPFKIFMLGILSGCHIGFGAFLSIAVGGACPQIGATNPGLKQIISGAFGLPFGLMMTVIAGGELFTGNTAMLAAALIDKKASFAQLIKSWSLSYAGNFVGSLLLASLAFYGGSLGASPAAASMAIAKTSLSFSQAFIRGILCNWLVCMAIYMASGSSSLGGKMTAIWFPISSFIALGLEHSVANMFIIPLGMLRGAPVSASAFLFNNLFPVTLGNIVGGAVFVAGAYSSIYGPSKDKQLIISDSSSSVQKDLSASVDASSEHPAPAYLSIRGGSSTPIKRTGASFLPPATLERAAAGNMFEKVKIKKDPSEVWTDLHDWAAAIREGKTSWEDIGGDDIDIRVKYAGMFHRKKATPGKFMMRLRIPNGIINSDHMRYYAQAVRPYGPEIGVVDITTRMNIQLRGMPLEDGSSILKGLQARGQTSVMSGLDNLRNMVGSPIAGIDPYELFDTRELTKEIDTWYTNGGVGNPEWANMPRKFNIAISGSRDDFAHTHINDIGLTPVKHEVTGEVGFNVGLGGYFSIKRAAESIPMETWIRPSEVSNLSKSILRLFRDEGARLDRQKARLMWLIEGMGMSEFRSKVEVRMAEESPGFKFEKAQSYKEQWTHGHRNILGVHPQKQDGKSWVGIHVPVGRLSADECEEIAVLADKYSSGEIRLTVEQNVLFPNVDNSRVVELLAEPAIGPGKRLSANPGNIVGNVISCTGAQFCPIAIVETKASIDLITRKVQDLVDVPKEVRIHMTGCPNSCGQVQVADIGLMGAPAKKADSTGAMKAVSGVNIFIGGRIGEDSHLSLEPAIKGIPLTEEDLVPVLVKLLIENHGGILKVNEVSQL